MRSFLLCLLLWFASAAQAALVYQDIRPGIRAGASYQVGERNKPAVLLLHGFLQTREFATVATLANGLHDAGYTVLSPTLSLNIPLRSQSLACEAIHKHSLDEDTEEIARWVSWLKNRGHRSVVLLGHSFGSMQLLAYLAGSPDPAVKAYIGASLIEAQIGPVDRRALIEDLEARARSAPRALVSHPLSFCRKYTSTARDLLSYVRWDQARTLAALRRSPVENWLIMGDADTVLGHNWLAALRHLGSQVVVVSGANHFMDGEHEFTLLEHTLAFLRKLDKVAR
ncbi:MAG: alpha/beta fold hydrolase [Thiobacillus sp.]|nr:alpha/beta fold hydrolase [Thiobacillus sp.]